MEGHNNHTYLPEDMNFDEIMNGGWPATTNDNTQYTNFQQAPDQYARYTPDQSTYANYDLNISQAPSYPTVPYHNSPYVSQFTNTRPSNAFNQNSYAVDPSMSARNYHGHGNGYAFTPQAMENTTIAPQNLQYAMPQTVNHAPNAFQQRPVVEVPSYAHRPTQDALPAHTGMYYNSMPNRNPAVTQNSLPQYANTPLNNLTPNSTITVQRPSEKDKPVVQRPLLVKEMPQQDFLRVTRPELLSTHSSTRPPFEYAAFIHWEDKPVDITLGLKSK